MASTMSLVLSTTALWSFTAECSLLSPDLLRSDVLRPWLSGFRCVTCRLSKSPSLIIPHYPSPFPTVSRRLEDPEARLRLSFDMVVASPPPKPSKSPDLCLCSWFISIAFTVVCSSLFLLSKETGFKDPEALVSPTFVRSVPATGSLPSDTRAPLFWSLILEVRLSWNSTTSTAVSLSSVISTSEGMVSVTLLLLVQWSRICLRLVRNSLSMRFHQFQLPQYEDFRLIIRFNRSFARMVVMCLKEKHSNQSLDYIGSGFGVNLYGSDYLSDRFDGDSVFPCIEGSFRLVLTVFMAKGLVPSISFGIYCVVDALWEGLCFTEGDVTSNSIRESSEWNEAFVPPPSSSRINSSFCGLGMFFQEAGSCVAPKHLSIRPYMLSAIITEVLLALRCVLDSVVETVINLLKVFSNIQSLFGLINSKVTRIKFSGFIHEISLFMCPFDPISYPFRSFSLNVVVVVVELSTPTLLFVSSSFNGV